MKVKLGMMQNKIKNKPAIVLTIAGSDSLSGGGIQADLATFNEYNIFGLSAITSIVTVMPKTFVINNEPTEILAVQLDSIEEHYTLDGVKLGLIPNLEQMNVILKFIQKLDYYVPLVIDPVLVFKENNSPELEDIKFFYLECLFPLATVITPNLFEAELLTGQKINSKLDLIESAKILKQMKVKNVVVKGGNRLNVNQAIDILITENNEIELLTDSIVKNNFNNGAGCTFSAAILSELVQDNTITMLNSIKKAKLFVHNGISRGIEMNYNFGNVWQGANRNV